MRRIWMAAAALALSACATSYPGEPASAHDDERADDAFALQIDTGRMGIFNDRISEALDMMTTNSPSPAELTPEQNAAADFKGARDNVRKAWLDFLAVRSRACSEGKFVAIACTPLAPPPWLGEPANQIVPPATIVRRLQELQDASNDLLNAACEEGKKLSKDEDAEMFCSVE